MKGKVDQSQLVIIRFFFCVGDKNLPAQMSQKLGPLGLKAKDITTAIDKDCKAWAGARIFIELHA